MNIKIALVGTLGAKGGAAALFLRDVHLLQQAGHEVLAFCDECHLPKLPDIEKYSIPSLYEKHVSSESPDIKNMLKSLKRIGPDVIHYHLTWLVEDPSIIARSARIAPVIMTPHTHQLTCPAIRRMLFDPMEPCEARLGVKCLIRPYTRSCLRRNPVQLIKLLRKTHANRKTLRSVTRMAVTCDYMRDEIASTGVPQHSIRVVQPHVNVPDAISPSEERGNTILFAGMFRYEKGVQYLPEIISKIKAPCSVLIAGVGWMLDRVKAEVRNRGLNNVEFLGWKSERELQQLYPRISIMVMPSIFPETFGLSGLEALAYGVPVVAFDVGAVSNWLNEGEHGYLLPVRDCEGMARRITQILNSTELVHRLGVNGHALVRKNYLAGHRIEKLEFLYNEIKR